MTKLWNSIDQKTGKGMENRAFRMVLTLICMIAAAAAAALVTAAGSFLGWEGAEVARTVVLAGGYGGVAGYFLSIFYELCFVRKK